MQHFEGENTKIFRGGGTAPAFEPPPHQTTFLDTDLPHDNAKASCCKKWTIRNCCREAYFYRLDFLLTH